MRRLAVAGVLLAGMMVVASADLAVVSGQPVGQPTPTPVRSPDVFVSQGELPLILAVAHGGERSPVTLEDRVDAVLPNDPGAMGLGEELAAEIERQSGHRPHLIVNRLARRKLDPNRGITVGAQGDPRAERAWRAYHQAIDLAASRAEGKCGRGLLIDLHTHGKSLFQIELGYGLTAEDLSEDDEDLAKRRFVYASNVRALATSTEEPLPDLLRGQRSLGGLLVASGYRAVPSPEIPVPKGAYFDGGYTAYRHGSRSEGGVDAVQVELPFELVRSSRRGTTVASLAEALLVFMQDHYALEVPPGSVGLCSPYVDVSPSHWAAEAIDEVHRSGIMDPCGDDPRRFCPDQVVSREDGSLALWRALHPGMAVPESGHWPLTDLGEGPAGDAAAALWRAGYLDLCGVVPPRFCPQSPLDRGTLAAWALRLEQGRTFIPPRPEGRFVDASPSQWATWWLEPAAADGLIPPCPGAADHICPEGLVSRADLAWTLFQARPSPED